MISVDEAVARIAGAFAPLAGETVAVGDAAGRVLAEKAVARASQPPASVSSMDGYAVRAADAAKPGTVLRVIGAAPAGHPFAGRVGANEAVRIFTGGVMPDGVDSVVIQEDAAAEGDHVTFSVAAAAGQHVRAAGLDFRAGETLVPAGRRLNARDLSLIAAGDVAHVTVRRRPRIVFVATGDELSLPGAARKPGGIVASSGYALAAMIVRWGGEAVDLGILPDTAEAVAGIADQAVDADLVVTLGGASVGDHDLVQKALGPRGFALDFWKIAMRPGKPLIFGRLGKTPLLGLPGNPVSTLVCAMLFLRPAIAAMLGTQDEAPTMTAKLRTALKANDARQDYLRARLATSNGERVAEPFAVQDSSMLSVLARADALIVRAPHAPPAKAGDTVSILLLD
ncbi:MAG TPA: gephyrin-like molybdotransferase Glp [Rhizomicrobium sp.]|jgi:molybdopterin molybdotransferase|nr:gephyrin-like molybdotransferase Glp [Rhizomicrobium sp.]